MATSREFLWGAQRLPDPDPDLTPEQVRDYYSALYPELTTAAVEIKEGPGGEVTFAKAAKPAATAKQTVNFVANQGKRG